MIGLPAFETRWVGFRATTMRAGLISTGWADGRFTLDGGRAKTMTGRFMAGRIRHGYCRSASA